MFFKAQLEEPFLGISIILLSSFFFLRFLCFFHCFFFFFFLFSGQPALALKGAKPALKQPNRHLKTETKRSKRPKPALKGRIGT